MKEILRLIQAARYALEGLAYLIREEKNTRLLLVTAALTLIICPLIGFNAFQTVVVFFTVMATLVAEVINTAIEVALDLQVQGKYHQKVKIAKDVAASAVLLCIMNSVIVFLVILFSNLFNK